MTSAETYNTNLLLIYLINQLNSSHKKYPIVFLTMIMVTGRSALLLLLGARAAFAFTFAPAAHSTTMSMRSKFGSAHSKVVKGFATRAAIIAGSCIVFPQSSLAFSASSDVVSNTLNLRNIVGAGAALYGGGKLADLASNRARVGFRLAATSATGEETKKKVPITILAGFLGAGKTTALKRLLENTEGIKVGTVVNDVAAVNIDAKLISNPMNAVGPDGNNPVAKGNAGGTVELQNGCACCSLSDELLTSVSDLMEGRDLDAIVVELSGVADPDAVRQNWEAAVVANHPTTIIADLQRVVTVVDSHTFGSDWMSWDTAKKRQWAEEGDTCAESRQVPELLAEQVEAADVIILNKVDLSEGEQLETARLVVRSINVNAELIETKFGEMTPDKILPLGGLKEAVETYHNHEHQHHTSDCADPECTNESHEHSHSSHGHSHSSHSSDEVECADPSCSDETHNHGHSHSHSSECSDAKCNDASHSHSHDHTSDCSDPECNDNSHSHSHDHESSSTAIDSLGISNFVYKSSRAFDARKLQKVLNRWPIPVMEELNLVELSKELEKDDKDSDSPFLGVLRSKGFAWVSPTSVYGMSFLF
jgi:G3E family GTPase